MIVIWRTPSIHGFCHVIKKKACLTDIKVDPCPLLIDDIPGVAKLISVSTDNVRLQCEKLMIWARNFSEVVSRCPFYGGQVYVGLRKRASDVAPNLTIER